MVIILDYHPWPVEVRARGVKCKSRYEGEVSKMTIIVWIVFGLIAGSIANFLAPTFPGGLMGSVVLGILGAVVGGYIGQRFFGVGVTGFNLMSLVVAVAGALLVLLVTRLLVRG